jgi:hypothetical protein
MTVTNETAGGARGAAGSGSAGASPANFGASPKCHISNNARVRASVKVRDGEGAIASVRGARAPHLLAGT